MKMDLGKRTFQEIKEGYHLNDEDYCCHYCDATFSSNEVYSFQNKMYLAKQAVEHHIELEHQGNFQQLIANQSKYNTLTAKQKELLNEFQTGKSDAEIAKQMELSPSTIRHQKFTFREKAKQAKFYLALYELAFDQNKTSTDHLIAIHNGATMLDERYFITEKEQAEVLEKNFSNLTPLKLSHWPKKEKKKIIILNQIAKSIKSNHTYTEKEITQLLKEIYHDPVTLRRYLYDYGYLNRTPDGKAYWLNE